MRSHLRSSDRLPSARGLAAAVLVALAMAGAMPARAAWPAETTVADLTALPLEDLLDIEVSSASRFPQKASEAPSAVRVVTAAEIRAQGWRTLADALASLPGLYVSYDRSYAYLGARGFLRPGDYTSRFLLLVDGYRFNDPIYGQAAVGTDFAIDIDLIERIEYVPGPGSAIYGSNAFFGVINVVTRWPDAAPRSELSAEAGSDGARGLIGTYGWQGGSGAQVLVSASDRRSDGDDLYFPEYDDGQSDGVAAGLDGDRTERVLLKARNDSLNFSLSHARRRKDTPTAAFDQAFGVPGAFVEDERTLVDLGYSRRLGDTAELTGHFSYGRYIYSGDYIYDEPLLINRDGAEARWLNSEWKLLTTAYEGHQLAVGIEAQKDFHRDQSNFDVDPYHVYLEDHRDGERFGVFVEDEYTLTSNLLLNAGLRYDHDSIVGGDLSPRLALIRQSPTTTYKAIVGQAFRAPNAYELFYGEEGSFGQLPNPDLEVERIRTAELMASRQIGSQSTLGALLYHYQLSDLISQVENEPTGQLVFENQDEATATGVELSFDSRWPGGAMLRASYAYARVKTSYEGSRPANSPRHLLKLNATVPLWDERMLLGIDARYVGARHAKAEPVPSYELVNLSVTWPRLTERLELRASINNVFDQRYFDPAGSEMRQNAIEQDGRSVLFKLSYRF